MRTRTRTTYIIMDYERKYKDALEWMRSLYDGLHGATKEEAEHYFPELKENEDERIRKKLICFVENWKKGYNPNSPFDDYAIYTSDSGECDKILAWLEKQDEKDPCTNCINDKGCVTCENGNLKEAKVTPKFKVGDCVVLNSNRDVWQIGARYTEEGQHIYLYNVNDVITIMSITLDELNNDYHLWTIEDAKDGDVLVDSYSKDSIIILYKGINKEQSILAHCGWNGYNFSIKTNRLGYGGLDNTNYLPATKEQRELLFSKMKEAGYEWDSEKKELKKIEPKTLDADKVIAWLVANICDFEYYVKLFKKDFGL